MRTRCRGFLTCLLILCVVNSPLALYGQARPVEDKDITGTSAAKTQAQQEIEEYGRELTPEERDKKLNAALKCPGCTAEEKRAAEEFDATLRAAKAKHAEDIANAASNSLLKPTIDTFLVAPTTSDEYVRIFGTIGASLQNLTMAQGVEIRRIRRQMQADFGQSAGSRDLNSKNFRAAITNSQSSFILIVGHNDNGFFRFLDGSYIPLDFLVMASKPDQRMIIVSCKAEAMLSNEAAPKAAATRNDLTYAQAFEIAKTIQRYLASAGPRVSLQMVRQALQSAESEIAFEYNVRTIVKQVAFATGATIVIAIVISGPCLSKDDCH
jgi:hypothetical protein